LSFFPLEYRYLLKEVTAENVRDTDTEQNVIFLPSRRIEYMAQKRGVITTPAFVYKEDTNTAKRSQRMPYYSLKGRLARLLSVVSLFVVIIIPVSVLLMRRRFSRKTTRQLSSL